MCTIKECLILTFLLSVMKFKINCRAVSCCKNFILFNRKPSTVEKMKFQMHAHTHTHTQLKKTGTKFKLDLSNNNIKKRKKAVTGSCTQARCCMKPTAVP